LDPANSLKLNIYVKGGVSKIQVDKSSLPFGDVQINTQSDLTVNVTNAGDSDLVISPTSDVRSDRRIFNESDDAAVKLSSQQTQPIIVSFKPTILGGAIANLVLDTDDPRIRISWFRLPVIVRTRRYRLQQAT